MKILVIFVRLIDFAHYLMEFVRMLRIIDVIFHLFSLGFVFEGRFENALLGVQ